MHACGAVVLQTLRKNFALKILAVAIALSAWLYFHLATNPVIAARFDQQLDVPITVTGLRPGHVVTRQSERQAVVSVVAPRSGPPIKPEDVKAVLNLGDRPAGVFTVPVTIIGPSLEIRSLSPASVTLAIDRLEERTVPIAVVYRGAPNGYVVASLDVTPSLATIRGTALQLARVDAVRLEVPLLSKPATYDAMVRGSAADVSGTDVPGVHVSPNLIRVRARFVRGAGAAP